MSSTSANEPSSDTLSPPLSDGRDLCRNDDSHLAGPERCRGDRTDDTDDDDDGDNVTASAVPSRRLVQLNTQCYTLGFHKQRGNKITHSHARVSKGDY